MSPQQTVLVSSHDRTSEISSLYPTPAEMWRLWTASRCLPVMHALAAELAHGFQAGMHDLVQDVTIHFLPYLGGTGLHAGEPPGDHAYAATACSSGDQPTEDRNAGPPTGCCGSVTPCGLADSGSTTTLAVRSACSAETNDQHRNMQETSARAMGQEQNPQAPIAGGRPLPNQEPPAKVDICGASHSAREARSMGQDQLNASSVSGPRRASKKLAHISMAEREPHVELSAPAGKLKARGVRKMEGEVCAGSGDLQQSALWLTFKNPRLEAQYAAHCYPAAGQVRPNLKPLDSPCTLTCFPRSRMLVVGSILQLVHQSVEGIFGLK